MSYPFYYPKLSGANVQIFYGSDIQNTSQSSRAWVKPQGASFVWFTLIGGGSNGNNGVTGGNCGSVFNTMLPAFLIPDILQVRVARGPAAGGPQIQGPRAEIYYVSPSGGPYLLFRALGGGAGGTPNQAINAAGFYQYAQGGSSQTATTTFLTAGGTNLDTVTPAYGYPRITGHKDGYFLMGPVICGAGGTGYGRGGIGCGGGHLGEGSQSMAIIITW